jgi:hypothetical protein
MTLWWERLWQLDEGDKWMKDIHGSFWRWRRKKIKKIILKNEI